MTRRSSRSRVVRPSSCCRSARWRSAFSVMITAPSTMRPKSSAPRLIRLAEIRPCDHAGHGHQHRHRDDQRGDDGGPDVAEQQEQDHDDEGRRPRRGSWRRSGWSPRRGKVRSRTVWTSTPGGSVRAGSRSMRASTAAATVRLFSPISIRAVPMTASLPVLASPSRCAGRARSGPRRCRLIRTGTPPRLATTTLAISSMLSRRPGGAHDVALAVLLQVARALVGVVGLQRPGDVGEGQVEGGRASSGPAGRGTASRSRRCCRPRRRRERS